MKTHMLFLSVFALFVLATPMRAQDETGTMVEETADPAMTDETETVETPAHDWEFVLQSTNNAPEGGGIVKVTEGEGDQTFRLEVEGLPLIDDLDNEDRDVNAYTVWVVPSKDQVNESTLAGVITVGPEGTGTFDGTTSLETFGVIVTATADGAPESITGVPVLTGIPVANTPAPDAAEAAAEVADEAVEDAEDAAEATEDAAEETAEATEDAADAAAEATEEAADEAVEDAEAVAETAEEAAEEAEEEADEAAY